MNVNKRNWVANETGQDFGVPGAETVMDRIWPTRQPTGRVVMRQQWRDLLFLHWPFAPETIQALLPSGLRVDNFAGQAWVGLVPFTMRNVRPSSLPPLPWLSHFHETNVRTYVHYQGQNPGVWFFSLDAANPVAVQIARLLFHLPYYFASMQLERERGVDGETLRYVSHRAGGLEAGSSDVTAVPCGTVQTALPGTLEHFLCERYLLYSQRKQALYRGQVHHSPYPLQTAHVQHLEENLFRSAGVVRPNTPPLVHYASGVDVTIYPLTKI